LNSKINEFYLELGVLTKNVTVMLFIVLAEAAQRKTTFLQTFGIPKISQTFYPFYKKCKI
jgi:hypothetical protein